MSEPEMCPVAILFGTDVIQNVVPVSVGFRETLKSAVLMEILKNTGIAKRKKMNCRFSPGIAMKNILAPDWKCGEAGGCARFFCVR